MVTVAVDGNGADLGPDEVAAGASLAAGRGIQVLLFAAASEIGEVAEGVKVIDAPISIAKDPDPASAVRRNPDASIVQATRAVAAGRAQALVSGGSTGSALAAGLSNLKKGRGIYRPALALPIPRPDDRPVLVLDVGANVTCRPEHLVQFAHMGSAFAQTVMGTPSPRVALLSNGTEPTKGTDDLRQVYERLSGEEGAGLRFIGNIEGTDVMESVADVVVTDGFSGNIALKLIEGVSGRTMKAMRMAAMRSWRARVGGFLLAPSVRDLREEIDPETTGGAYMLGLRQIGVVAHGRFSRRGFAQAIEVAARGVDQDVVARTQAALQEAGALHIRPHHVSAGAAGDELGAPESGSGDPSTTSEQAATVAGQ